MCVYVGGQQSWEWREGGDDDLVGFCLALGEEGSVRRVVRHSESRAFDHVDVMRERYHLGMVAQGFFGVRAGHTACNVDAVPN